MIDSPTCPKCGRAMFSIAIDFDSDGEATQSFYCAKCEDGAAEPALVSRFDPGAWVDPEFFDYSECVA